MPRTNCDLSADCGLRGELSYAGVVVVSLFVPPWKAFVGFLAALLGYSLAVWEGIPMNLQRLVVAALVMWLLDTLAGSLRGFVKREEGFSSNRFGCSLTKGLVFTLSLIAAQTLDTALALGNSFAVGVATLILIREASSFVGNTAILGFRWPEFMVTRLKDIEDKLMSGGSEDGTELAGRVQEEVRPNRGAAGTDRGEGCAVSGEQEEGDGERAAEGGVRRTPDEEGGGHCEESPGTLPGEPDLSGAVEVLRGPVE